MARIKVNPEAEVRNFAPVKAGTYFMKVETSEEKTSEKGNAYINWRLSFVDPADRLQGLNGQPLKGMPGNIFYRTMLAPEQQWKLRAIVECALGSWRDFDENELYGKEVTCIVGEEEYQGDIKNVITRIVKE